MKLLKSLINLISEVRGKEYRLFPNIRKGKRTIIFFESAHQKYDRSGDLDIFAPENRHIYTKMMEGFWRSGLPTDIIRRNIEENFDKIWNESTTYLNTCQEDCRILFKSKDKDLEKIEYVIAMYKLDDNVLKFVVVTSYLSYDKDYLKSLKRNDPTVVLSESVIDFEKIKVVYL